jgi:hypothetical protein
MVTGDPQRLAKDRCAPLRHSEHLGAWRRKLVRSAARLARQQGTLTQSKSADPKDKYGLLCQLEAHKQAALLTVAGYLGAGCEGVSHQPFCKGPIQIIVTLYIYPIMIYLTNHG